MTEHIEIDEAAPRKGVQNEKALMSTTVPDAGMGGWLQGCVGHCVQHACKPK